MGMFNHLFGYGLKCAHCGSIVLEKNWVRKLILKSNDNGRETNRWSKAKISKDGFILYTSVVYGVLIMFIS